MSARPHRSVFRRGHEPQARRLHRHGKFWPILPRWRISQIPIAPVPQLYRWSDIAYFVWANACSTANVNPNTIQYFFRYHINNDSGTQDIIKQAAGVTSAAGLKPWPGMKFDTTTPQGEALLGSAHGFGVAWFLQQHQATLGKKAVDYITVFQTTDASVGTQYNMMIHVADVS